MLTLVALGAPVLLAAQNVPEHREVAAPQLDVSITSDGMLSRNIASKSFWLQGGAVQVHGLFNRGWGVVGDFAGVHVANIGSDNVGLDLVTATFGTRYTPIKEAPAEMLRPTAVTRPCFRATDEQSCSSRSESLAPLRLPASPWFRFGSVAAARIPPPARTPLRSASS